MTRPTEDLPRSGAQPPEVSRPVPQNLAGGGRPHSDEPSYDQIADRISTNRGNASIRGIDGHHRHR